MRRRRLRLFDGFRSYAAMPNSSAMKVACAIAFSFATHLALPFRIICTAWMPAISARRLRMSRTLSPATSAPSLCDGLAPPHYASTCIDGDEPDEKNTFFRQRSHGSRIGRVLVHVITLGTPLPGRKLMALRKERLAPARSRLAVSSNSMVWPVESTARYRYLFSPLIFI